MRRRRGSRGSFYDEAEVDAAERFFADLVGQPIARRARPTLRSEARPRVPSPSSSSWAEDAPGPTSGDPLVRCHERIKALVTNETPAATYYWKYLRKLEDGEVRDPDEPPKGGSQAPNGYLQGICLVFARVYCKLKAGDVFAVEMAKAASKDTTHDALALYADKFKELGMVNDTDGVQSLRRLFGLMAASGMVESNGTYNRGKDAMRSSSDGLDELEAGMFQTSYTLGVGSTSVGGSLKRQWDILKLLPYPGLREVFAQGNGIKPLDKGGLAVGPDDRRKPANLQAYLDKKLGSHKGDVGYFRQFLVMQPGLAAEIVALGMRRRLRHWGPLRERRLFPSKDMDALLEQVQNIVDEGRCCEHADTVQR